MRRPAPTLTLGPLLLNWPSERWRDFYARIADEAPVDRVCIGEVVCSKRSPFRDEVMGSMIERLGRAGKEVVHATLALPTTAREIAAIRALVESGQPLEANDIATIGLLAGRPHLVGPLLNIYNEETLALHLALGATRVCLPPELSLETIRTLAAGCDAIEVFVFGRAPLALSARCHHARTYGRSRDTCQLVCERDPDGLEVLTVDGRPFLALNGTQTLGHVVTAAVRQVSALRAAGVASLRLSPQSCDMVRVAAIFNDLLEERSDAEEASAALQQLDLPGPLADGFLRGVPGARQLQEHD
jgi:collagenase-like PrtC family protease